MSTPYKTMALRYLTHGWSPLPVGNHPGEKTPPPTGFTGNAAPYPDEDQIASWVQSHPDRNIGIRMPDTVIGIDVDGYDDKPGVFTMAATAQRHGKLPKTWTSTSRSDMSGIRWFRLPHPIEMPGKLIHPDDDTQSGVEVIQRHHRFAVVPPSIHPSGRAYRWITPEGKDTDSEIPTRDQLPELPQAWIEHILKQCSCWAGFDWERHKTERKDPVQDAYDKWVSRMTASYGRHDAALGGVMALEAFRARGWPKADELLAQLESDFYTSLGDSRDDREAKAEWQRMIDGAREKSHTTTIPQWEDRTPPPAPSTPEEVDQAVIDELTRLRVRDRARQLFEREQSPRTEPPAIQTLEQRLATPLPEIRWRIEGWQPMQTRVLLAAQFKAGKTTLTGNLARCLVDNQRWLDVADVTPVRKVTILDFEMGERQINQWLADQGIENPHRVSIGAMRGRTTAFNIIDEQTRSEWAKRLSGTDYLILDCLRPILDSLGLDEHKEGGRFLTAFDELCDEAGIPDALIVHHMGHHGERARGDSRFRDWPDVEWRLMRESEDPSSDRYIAAYGRDVDQSEGLIDYDDTTRHIRLLGGNRLESAARRALPDVEMWLAGRDPLPTKKDTILSVNAEFGHAQKDIQQAIELGIRDGLIQLQKGAHNRHLLTVPINQIASSAVRHSSVADLSVSSADLYRSAELKPSSETT